MDTTDLEDRVERTVRSHDGPHYRLRRDSTWLILTPEESPLPAHGWKLHISSRVATFPDLVERLVPVLLAEGCAFKLARSPQVLRRLNSGLTSPAAVGKAFTIYPDQARIRELDCASPSCCAARRDRGSSATGRSTRPRRSTTGTVRSGSRGRPTPAGGWSP